MAGKRELKVVILGDSSKAQRAFNTLERSGSRLGDKMGGLGSKMAGVGKAIAAAGIAAGTAAAAFGVKALNAASDLNEQISKVGVVFGESAGLVTKFADKMAKDFGLPKAQILEAAGAIGLVGKASGLTQKDAADLGTNMASLAADASSFYNVPLEEALDTIRSALVGEAEPIRKFGVLLNESAVNAEAVALGIAKAGDKLTEQQKVMARTSLITKGMTDATGDLVRTQDSFANRLRELRGRAENFAAAVGTKLLPYALKAFDLMQKWGPVVQRLAQRVGRELAPVVERVADFIRNRVIPALQQFAGYITETVLPALKGAWEFLRDRFLSAFNRIRDALSENREGLKELADFITTKVLPVLGIIAGVLIEGLGLALAGAITLVGSLTAAWDDFVATLRTVVAFIVDKLLASFEWITRAAAAAFGWVPFIGDDLKKAARDVEKFRNDVNNSIRGISEADIRVGVRSAWQASHPMPAFMQGGRGGGNVSNSYNTNIYAQTNATPDHMARELSWRRKAWGR